MAWKEEKGQHFMYLEEALEILVKEWTQLETIGETDLALADVVKKLGGESWKGINPELSPGEVAGLIEQDMKRLGVSSMAETFISRFRTEDELLTETSLYDLVSELGIREGFHGREEEFQGQNA